MSNVVPTTTADQPYQVVMEQRAGAGVFGNGATLEEAEENAARLWRRNFGSTKPRSTLRFLLHPDTGQFAELD